MLKRTVTQPSLHLVELAAQLDPASEEERLAAETIRLMDPMFHWYQRAVREMRESNVPPDDEGYYTVHITPDQILRFK